MDRIFGKMFIRLIVIQWILIAPFTQMLPWMRNFLLFFCTFCDNPGSKVAWRYRGQDLNPTTLWSPARFQGQYNNSGYTDPFLRQLATTALLFHNWERTRSIPPQLQNTPSNANPRLHNLDRNTHYLMIQNN